MQKNNYSKIAMSWLLLACAQAAVAEVKEVTENSFTIEHRVMIGAPAGAIFATLGDDLKYWWDPSQTESGDPENLYLDGEANGCLCEILPTGGSVEILHLVYVSQKDRIVRFTGALGDLRGYAVNGAMTWDFNEVDGTKTETVFTYRVSGHYPGGMKEVANKIDAMMNEQVASLKVFAEDKQKKRDEEALY